MNFLSMLKSQSHCKPIDKHSTRAEYVGFSYTTFTESQSIKGPRRLFCSAWKSTQPSWKTKNNQDDECRFLWLDTKEEQEWWDINLQIKVFKWKHVLLVYFKANATLTIVLPLIHRPLMKLHIITIVSGWYCLPGIQIRNKCRINIDGFV